MKQTIVLILILTMSNLKASECSELMKSFLENQDNATSKTEKKIDITKYGFEDTLVDQKKFERLYASCMSPDKNSVKNLASSKINKVFIGMSAATSIIGYTQTNWEKPKDMEWFGRLGYTLVFGAVSAKIYSKLIVDKGNKFHYLIKDYIYGRSAVVTWSVGNILLFSNDKENQKKLDKLKNSPTFEADMKALEKYVDNDSFYERYKNEVMAYLSLQEENSIGLGVQENVDFDHLTAEDLKNPEVQKVVIAALNAQEYELRKGPISTGSASGDALLFDSAYSIAKIPKDLLVERLTTQVMCLNMHNPKRGMTQAIAINTLNQILFADFYGITYRVAKKELIGN